MCGGGCRYCFEDQLFDSQQHDAEEHAYREAMEQAYHEQVEAEYYEEMWWNEWLTMNGALSKTSSPEVF